MCRRTVINKEAIRGLSAVKRLTSFLPVIRRSGASILRAKPYGHDDCGDVRGIDFKIDLKEKPHDS
jgi:hypothetical protein